MTPSKTKDKTLAQNQILDHPSFLGSAPIACVGNTGSGAKARAIDGAVLDT